MAHTVFVGRRRAALLAAERLGLDVTLVDEKEVPPAVQRRLGRCFHQRLTRREEPWADLAGEIAAGRPPVDSVFALTERAVVPAARLREALGTAGLEVRAARRATDKLLMKRAWKKAGVPCAEASGAVDVESPDELADRLGLPLVWKARISSGGRRNVIVRSPEELPAELERGWMAERFVQGTEMSVETLVRDGEVLFANPTEYVEPRWTSLAPAALDAATLDAVLDLNRRAIAALGIGSGFTHLELFLAAEGPVASEVAARLPGGHLTEILHAAYGFDPWEAWLASGLGHRVDLPLGARQVAAATVLHPGPGTVRRVEGLDAARALPGVEAAACRLRPGDVVTERRGAGQEVGHLVVSGPDRDTVLKRLAVARSTLRIELDD